jgi:hypothetical protein
MGPEHCIYCGDWYECRDHVIPINYEQSYRDFKPGATVKCCTECNSFLGDRGYHTIQKRAKYLVKAYVRNRARYLNLPDWELSDLDKLGYNLRTSTENKLAKKYVYSQKLENLELVSNGFLCRPFRYHLDAKTGRVTTATKNCLNCGLQFFNVDSKEVCGEYCNGRNKAKQVAAVFPLISNEEAERRLEDRSCLVCDISLTTTNERAYFCSNRCSNALNSARQEKEKNRSK